jgi:hypothetical protein
VPLLRLLSSRSSPSRRSRRSKRYTWKIGKAGPIGGDDETIGGDRSRGDDEIVRASWLSGSVRVSEEAGVEAGDLEVVVLDWNRPKDLRDVGVARGPTAMVGEFDADEELRCRHRGNCHVVLIPYDLVEQNPAPLRVDEDRGIEDQSSQLGS